MTLNSFVVRYNFVTGETHILVDNDIAFPGDHLTSFSFENLAFIIPGIGLNTSLNQKIIKYDMSVEKKTEYLDVKDFPFPGSFYNTGIYFTTAVYVEKLNRVYIFGGIELGPNGEEGKVSAYHIIYPSCYC